MNEETKALAGLLDSSLCLTVADQEYEVTTEDHLTEILVNYSSIQEEIPKDSKSYVPCDLRTYVDTELATRFQLSNTDSNFNTSTPESWSKLFERHWNSTQYALSLQIIISLANLSLLNKTKLGFLKDLKETLFMRLTEAQGTIPLVEARLIDLFGLVLTLSVTASDLLDLYTHFSKSAVSQSLDLLATQLSDPLSQAYLQFENCYEIFKVAHNEDPRYTLQFFVEFNNVTSNRIMTIGKNIYLEIKEGQLCVSNDEFIIALFEMFEFEAGVFYSIAFTMNRTNFSLFVDGNFVDSITLFDGSITSVDQFDLGSMICSFKVFRFAIFNDILSEESIRVTFAMGSCFRNTFQKKMDIHGIRTNGGDGILERLCENTTAEGITLDQALRKTEEINQKELLIDVDPADAILPARFKNRAYSVGLQDESEQGLTEYPVMGKCFHFKPAPLLSMFTSVNCFRFIICSIESSEDMDTLYKYLSHLMTLLENDHLRDWFQRDYGFSLLSHVLITKVVKKITKPLPIQFLNLFQDFCGWNFLNITKSIIENETAYQNIILNFDLWYFDSPTNDVSQGGIEIIRFLLFQICSLLETSRFRTLNSEKLRRLNVLETISNNQHLFYERYPNVFDGLKNDLTNVYISLLKDDLRKANIQWLLQYSYFELKCQFYQNAEVALTAVDSLFTSALDEADTDSIRVFTNSISPKFLLMVLDEIAVGSRNPMTVLNVLLKLLLVNQVARRNFIKSNGLDLIFGILRTTDPCYYEDIVYLLYSYSLGDYNVDPNLKVSDEFENDSVHSNVTLFMKELLFLAINLLEWAVINDISGSFPLDLDCFISTFIKKMAVILVNSSNEATIDSFVTSLYFTMSELLTTLTKPQNSLIYENSAMAILKLLCDNITRAMMSLSTWDFERFMETMINPVHQENCTLRFNGKEWTFFELSFLRMVIPSLFVDLRELGDFFTEKLFENECMLSNFMVIFNRFKQQLVLFRIEVTCYINALECIATCIKATKERSDFKNISLSSLNEAFSFIMVTVLFPKVSGRSFNADNFNHFYAFIEKESELLFRDGQSLCDSALTRFILVFLFLQINENNSDSAVKCIETIFKYRPKEVEAILEMLGATKYSLLEVASQLPRGNHENLTSPFNRVTDIFERLQKEDLLKYAVSKTRVSDASKIVPDDQLIKELCKNKDSRMESKISEIEKRQALFRYDNITLDKKLRTNYRKHYANFVTDKEEDMLVHNHQYYLMKVQLKHTLSLQQSNSSDCAWGLDSVENFNGIRGRLVPIWKAEEVCDLEIDRSLDSEDTRGGDVREQAQPKKTTNSLFSYDLMSDLENLDTMAGDNRDENRKILKVLKGNDSIRKIWNTSLVVGLDVREGILIFAQHSLYFVSNYYFVKEENRVLQLCEVPELNRDTNIYLITGSSNKPSMPSNQEVHTWQLSDLIFVTKRPFLLRDAAMELLFENGTSFFLSFNNRSYRDDVYHTLEKLPKNENIDPVLYNILQELNNRSSSIGLKNGIYKSSLKTKFVKAFSSSLTLNDLFSATAMWQRGDISNFYYLMTLNTLAGRTFNDITQYPIFPWVIADYTSEELDLNDPLTFRDFSKPMGAQSEKRKLQFIERYEALEALMDPSSPPFHYGTHYSSAMIVSSYLIRLKPFVESFLLLQDGRFGHADRLFNSIGRAWSSAAIENTTDVRELTPEFFFLPDFLVNLNNFDLGKDQQGKKVSDVMLPPWAKGDPKIFIAKNREALESPYVSEHLHLWIDLVFGFKQRGEKAVSAVNVFNNLSYPGAVNLDSISDENERRAVTGIIHNFGQTPLQIFQEAHPQKLATSIKQINFNTWKNIRAIPNSTYRPQNDTEQNSSVKYIYWELYPDGSLCWKGYPFLNVMIRTNIQLLPLELTDPFSLKIGSKTFGFVHFSRITSFSLWKQQEFITGDESGLIKIWRYQDSKETELTCLGSLYGHLSEIKDFRTYSDYNALLSLDHCGTVYLWDVINCQLIRKVSSIGLHIAISQNQGSIAVYTMDNTLHVYNFGGMLYLSKLLNPDSIVTCLEFMNFSAVELASKRHAYWKEKEVILVGYNNGTLEVYELRLGKSWEFELLKKLETGKGSDITSIRTQLRVHEYDDGTQNPTEIPKLEIMAGDSKGFLYLWR